MLAYIRQLPYAGGGKGDRAPCTPGQELRPLEPQFGAAVWRMSGADGSGTSSPGIERLRGSTYQSRESVL